MLPTYDELKESLRSDNPPALHLVLWSLLRGCNAARDVSRNIEVARERLNSVTALKGEPEIYGNECIKKLCAYGSHLSAAQRNFEDLVGGVLGLPIDLDGDELDELLDLAPAAVQKVRTCTPMHPGLHQRSCPCGDPSTLIFAQ